MASPTMVLVAKKVAVDVATDKRTWILIGSIIAGLITLLSMPVFIIYSATTAVDIQTKVIELCFNEEEIPDDFGINNTSFIENMRTDFTKIDEEMGDINTENEDLIFMKSAFYVLSIDNTLIEEALTDDFYSDYVKVFFTFEIRSVEGVSEEIYIFIKDKERIYSNLESMYEDEITDKEKNDIDLIYNFIKYGTTPDGMSDFTGVPPEALEDEVFRQLMTEATKYIDMPYVWGGSTPETSFDCSGFICWVYTQSGVYDLPRTTAQGIYEKSIPISREEAKAGDLVFFTKTYKTDNPVTHVGIVMGDGRMLHCGSPIGYADIDSSYWSSHFYGFGRLQ